MAKRTGRGPAPVEDEREQDVTSHGGTDAPTGSNPPPLTQETGTPKFAKGGGPERSEHRTGDRDLSDAERRSRGSAQPRNEGGQR